MYVCLSDDRTLIYLCDPRGDGDRDLLVTDPAGTREFVRATMIRLADEERTRGTIIDGFMVDGCTSDVIDDVLDDAP